MNHSLQSKLLTSFVCLSMLLTVLLSGIGQSANAQGPDTSTQRGRPLLMNMSKPSSPQMFTVEGAGFTPSGQVYLAIYDQAGARLYEHRMVHAMPKLNADQAARLNDHGVIDAVETSGGTINQTFQGLCGASAMMRAEDVSTGVWTGWLMVEPKCGAQIPGDVANDLDLTFSLPVAAPQPSAAVIAGSAAGAVDPPLLLIAPANSDVAGVVTVTGLGMTSGGRVYLAVYDQMGAQLYENRWVKASPYYATDGQNVYPEINPVMTKSASGLFQTTFKGLCGANVMIRAYDAGTQTWSNWIETNNTCSSDPAAPTLPNGQPAKN
jgi:hypothetical protein